MNETNESLRGEVILSFAFDVANEIDTKNVRTILSHPPRRLALRSDRSTPKSVPFYLPLESDLGLTLRSGGRPVRVVVRVYDVGVITITLRISVEVPTLGDLRSFHSFTLDDGRSADALAASVCADVYRELVPVMIRPSPPSEPEAYTIFCLTALGRDTDANRWLAECAREAAGLLSDTDPLRLSDTQVDEIVRMRRSFENSDLVVIDWDSALVIDRDGYAEDVLFVLELANIQLEEFRWMDRYLDDYLDKAYADLEQRRVFGTGAVLQSLRRLRIDLTKLADEVAHITKFIGDWHLARVYLLARERFHLDQWRASVDQRLSHLDKLYTLVQSERHDRRMLWLEIIIVAFFAADICIILLRR